MTSTEQGVEIDSTSMLSARKYYCAFDRHQRSKAVECTRRTDYITSTFRQQKESARRQGERAIQGREKKEEENEKAYFSIHIEVIRNYVFDVTLQHGAPETQEQWIYRKTTSLF